MFIRIERGAAAPISRQIAEQIRAQCLSGVLKPGEGLPSVRQLARELAVNVNTVFRVYEQLAGAGVIDKRHGEGTFVAAPAKRAKAASELTQQREQHAREFEAVVRRGLLLGLTIPELRQMLSSAAAEAKSQIAKQSRSEEPS